MTITGPGKKVAGGGAQLKDKVQNALDESRILILLTQVMLGFQYRSPFEKGFQNLPPFTQDLKLCGHIFLLLTLALLLLPASYHRIVENGNDSPSFHHFTTRVIEIAFLPFILALGIDFYIAAEKILGRPGATLFGLGAAFVALFFLYGLEWKDRANHRHQSLEGEEMADKRLSGSSELKDKIKHVLTEARMILPGTQALLGFQLSIILLEGFEQLPAALKYLHLVSLAMIGLSAILLLTPAAYHRIVEQGEETAHFHRFASRFVLAATVPLALGVSGDLWIVVDKITGSVTLATLITSLIAALFFGLWFGLPLYAKFQRH